LICAKNRVDLSSISEVRSYITEWPRFFGPPCSLGHLKNDYMLRVFAPKNPNIDDLNVGEHPP